MLPVRTIARFRKALRKLSKSGSFNHSELEDVVQTLSQEKELDKSHRDHPLVGSMSCYRECHIEFDLLLIYKIEDRRLILVNIGSHPDLFG